MMANKKDHALMFSPKRDGERSEHPLLKSDKPAYRQVGDKLQVTKSNLKY
jgi:hypothetical protein